MTIELTGENLYDKETAHLYLEDMMELPDYYGRNLDALYDCLTDICEDTTIIINFNDGLPEDESYAAAMLAAFEEAADENEYLTVEINDLSE